MDELHCFTNGTDTVVAHDIEDARVAMREYLDESDTESIRSNHAYPVATPARAGSATKHGTFQTDGSVSCCGAADVTRTITRWAESSERRVNHKRAASRFQELSMRNVSCTPAGSWQTSGTLSTISKSPSQRSTAMIRMACWSMAT